MCNLAPLAGVVTPTPSKSIVIMALSAMLGSDITAGDAAVVDVSSPASIESTVLKIELPPSLTSNNTLLPALAVLTFALTPTIVIANGARNVTLAAPIVRFDVSSLHAIIIQSTSSVNAHSEPLYFRYWFA